MIQHMQCQNHQAKVHQEQQRGNVNLADMVAAEPDRESAENNHMEEEKSKTDSQKYSHDVKNLGTKEDNSFTTEEERSSKRIHKCQLCNYETEERSRLHLHNVTQHGSQSVIKCPMCPEYLSDTVHFQLHLIEVHNLTSREENSTRPTAQEESIRPSNTIGGTLEAIQIPCKQALEEESRDGEASAELLDIKTGFSENSQENPTPLLNDAEETFSERCQHCGDILTSKEKWQLHLEIHRIQASAAASASSDHHSERTCSACQATFSTLNQLRQHLQTKHHIQNIQRGKDITEPRSPEFQTRMDVDDPEQHGDEASGDTNYADIFSDPRHLLLAICADATFANQAMKDLRFEQVWDDLDPPFTCSPCEETFVCKSDLYEHLKTASTHQLRKTGETGPVEQNSELGTNEPMLSANSTESRDQTKQVPLDGAIENIDEPSNREEDGGQKTEDSQGISKSAHKKVLQDVGFNQVAHFVENRSSENRERARKWKREHLSRNTDACESDIARDEINCGNVDANNNELKQTLEDADRTSHLSEKDDVVEAAPNEDRDAEESYLGDAPRTENLNCNASSQFVCGRCGKEFSNMWILKVHEKTVHNVDMSPETLEEFVKGYTTWYWDCVKKDSDEGNRIDDSTQSYDGPDTTGEHPNGDFTKADFSAGSATNDDKGFRQVALQALMKNYPGLLGSYGIASTAMPPAEDQPKLQQQMLLQMLMTAQAQAAMQQQTSTATQSQGPTQTNASNIMNMLVDHLYGAAMHGITPGFMDPMGVMSLLQQQQQQPRLPAGVNPYQLLAMRYLHQQQMQQLLMYPAMATTAGGVPFLPNLSDNANQHQMLAAFAASLMSPGVSPDTAGSMISNPIAAALHAYQLQAATATLTDRRSGGKEPEQDPATILRMQQRDSTTVITQPPQSAEIPTKRPRTRITDDQLKILRANFDINTSPSENQISEMAIKTNLPPKVIKHWFRNTLFKERQRSKDSPYNFSIPPMTSLDDVTRDGVGASRENNSSPLGQSDQNYSPTQQSGTQRRVSEQSSTAPNDLHGASSTSTTLGQSSMSENEAIQFLKSLSERNTKNTDMQRTIFSNPMSLIHNLNLVPEGEKASTATTNTDTGRRGTAEKDVMQMLRRDVAGDSQLYGFDKANSQTGSEYSYQSNATPGTISTISRRTPRTRFSDYQLKVLQEFFDKNAYPKDEDLDKLSRTLELSTRVIVVWFQNARQKARKSYEMQQGAMNSSNGIPTVPGYPRKRQSSPSSPGQQSTKTFSAARPLDIQPGPKASSQYSRELVPRNKSPSTFSVSAKDEPRQRDNADETRDLESLRDRPHPSSYMSSVIQQYKMYYPSIIEGMVQGSSKDLSKGGGVGEQGSSPRSPDCDERRHSERSGKGTEMKSQGSHVIDDIISQLVLPQTNPENRRKDSSDESNKTNAMQRHIQSQFTSQREGAYATKRKMNMSPTQGLTSPSSSRGPLGRKGINDSSKDPKRLRTTITPEQLEFLYQQYLVDSSPSRKVIEQISDIVGLKKRVVQVWFQNTRARERKGQFRSVGRITSVLGMPQICPHCRVTFRTKADLDAHVRYRHMQSPSAATIALSQNQHLSSAVNSLQDQKPNVPTLSSSLNTTPGALSSSSRVEEQSLASSKDKTFDYKEILNSLNKQMKERFSEQTHSSKLHGSSYEAIKDEKSTFSSSFPGAADLDASSGSNPNQSLYTGDGPTSPKRHKTSERDTEHQNQFVTSSSPTKLTPTSKTSEIYKAVSEQIFGSKGLSSVDMIAQRLQGKAAISAAETTSNDASRRSTALLQGNTAVLMPPSHENRGPASPPVSSPESGPSSTSPPFMVPLKRYRTQMTSLQVRSLKHCFSEYKTPTLLECEILGDQIGLAKRVIQVWFQNARAKEKKAKQGDMMPEHSDNPMQLKSSCRLCPDMRFGSSQEYRNHIFSKNHLQNVMSACDGDASDDQSLSSGRRTPSSDGDEYQPKDLSNPSSTAKTQRHSPQGFTFNGSDNKFGTSSSNGSYVKPQPHNSSTGWEATAYAALAANPSLSQKYQQFATVQKFMNSGSVQNGVDERPFESEDQNRSNTDVSFSSLNQSWIQQTLLANRMINDSKGRRFEGISSMQSRTEE